MDRTAVWLYMAWKQMPTDILHRLSGLSRTRYIEKSFTKSAERLYNVPHDEQNFTGWAGEKPLPVTQACLSYNPWNSSLNLTDPFDSPPKRFAQSPIQ